MNTGQILFRVATSLQAREFHTAVWKLIVAEPIQFGGRYLTTKPIHFGGRYLTTMTTKTVNDVIHNKDQCEFFLKLSEGQRGRTPKAYLTYAWVDPGHVDLQHTQVPAVYRGQGVAKLLAKAAFDFAVSEDVKMTLTCTYLQKYHRENPLPEYNCRVV